MDLLQKNKLLYARAGFGISLADYQNPKPVSEIVQQMLTTAPVKDVSIITDEEWTDYNPKAMKEAGDEMKRKEMKKEFLERTKDVNRYWMNEMATTTNPLLEKTALFWHGHFATHIENPYFDQKLLNIIRRNALGNFGDLLRQVSKSAAMLQFLNNRQNKKEHPNENFAREVMELFTLGRGHYTEDDVKEAARAFTGWNFDENGEFIFRKGQHDTGDKKFLGKTGTFDGDDILNMLLEQKQTAIFITQKIYRYYVSDERIDDKRVNELAAEFYKSKYDISLLLQNIFTADWFYKDKTINAKIKSPIELLTGYQRVAPITFDNEKTIINLQRILGQFLFNPPNVAGWPGGKNWIDNSSLVLRMRLPEALLGSAELNLELKETDREMMDANHAAPVATAKPAHQFRLGKAVADWSNYLAQWRKYNKDELPAALADYLLAGPVSREQLKEVRLFADTDSMDEYIKSLTILLMELPDYQLT